MTTVRLAYRDNDRTPVIHCIKAMAERYYGVDVKVIQIEEPHAFEAALFNHSCDVIIEHIEYLHTEAARGRKITPFCAPQIHRGSAWLCLRLAGHSTSFGARVWPCATWATAHYLALAEKDGA